MNCAKDAYGWVARRRVPLAWCMVRGTQHGPGAGGAPVSPLVGDEALEVPALLEPVVPGEGRPPDHDGDVGVGGGPAPAGLQLRTEEAQLQKSLVPVSSCHLFKFLRNCNLRRVKHFFLLFETK